MPSDHPPSPQSPSQMPFDTSDLPPKPTTSPRTGSSLPTPAHSINGSMTTTHDLMAEAAHSEESSNKRKRDLEDHGDREQKKVHIEDGRISINDLHLDVGQKYLLCRTPHPAGPVPFSEDLFERYGLSDIAQTVARTNADGTKKIIRKTYKNYISKILKLSGNFEADKKEIEAPDSLWSMMSQPAEAWDNQLGRVSKEIEKGIPEASLSSLGKAVTMARGAIPKDVWNPKVLGELGLKEPDSAKVVQNGSRTPIPLSAGSQRSGKAELPRPKRNIKKRTYGDASFEGYGEGFVDDETGYSTGGDGDDRAGRKRPKKAVTNLAQASFARQNSYGPGSIGV